MMYKNILCVEVVTGGNILHPIYMKYIFDNIIVVAVELSGITY